jgi:hypothetical protein
MIPPLYPEQSDYSSDEAWFAACREWALPLALKMLEDEGGAILYWKLPEQIDGWYPTLMFDDLHAHGLIGLDLDTDCYTHPDAIKVSQDGGYIMPHQFER